MKFWIIFAVILFSCTTRAQPLPRYCTDTAHVLNALVWPSDSLISAYSGPIRILDFNELQKFLKPKNRYKKINIDFSRQYIICAKICPQCQATCPPDFPECHRNSCRYINSWRLAERESTHSLDFTFSAVKTPDHPDTLVVNRETNTPLPDSIPQYIYLFRTVSDDCHALNRHQVYQDDLHKTITWTVHHVYGGCAALRYEQVYIRIKTPGVGYTFVFDDARE